jgi:hypothetical protein
MVIRRNFIIAISTTLWSGLPLANAADLAIRFHHRHEVEQLLAEPKASFSRCDAILTCVQFPVHLHPELSLAVREKLTTDRIIEEFIIRAPVGEVTESTFDPLVRRIAAAEADGWRWGDTLAYREPLFDELVGGPVLHPGPWKDRRLVSERDVKMLRARLRRAHAEGELERSDYAVCGLLYSWMSVGDGEKAFIQSDLDGLYVELNSRGGKWQPHGNVSTIGSDFVNPGHDFVAFGLPGTIDTARMMAWCLKKGLKTGITAGANLTDVWFIPMFDNLRVHLQNLKVDPGDARITWLLHHNREPDDERLHFFPETEENSMTWLVRAIDDRVHSEPE